MARNGVNKSELIRKYFENNPQASVKDCIAALGEGGVEVSYPLVFGVRGRMDAAKDDEKPREVSPAELKMVHDFVDKSNLDPDLATRILAEFVSLVRLIGTIDRFDVVLAEFGKSSKNSCDSITEVFPGVGIVKREEIAVVEEGSGSYTDVNDDEDD